MSLHNYLMKLEFSTGVPILRQRTEEHGNTLRRDLSPIVDDKGLTKMMMMMKKKDSRLL